MNVEDKRIKHLEESKDEYLHGQNTQTGQRKHLNMKEKMEKLGLYYINNIKGPHQQSKK